MEGHLRPLVALGSTCEREAGGGVHRLAAFLRGARGAGSTGARLRGPALGRRRAPRLPRPPCRLGDPVPLVLLCTARPELLERRVGLGHSANAATVSLPPFSDDRDPARSSAHLLMRRLVSPELPGALVVHAGGRSALRGGVLPDARQPRSLFRDGDELALRRGSSAAGMVQGIVAARLDALADGREGRASGRFRDRAQLLARGGRFHRQRSRTRDIDDILSRAQAPGVHSSRRPRPRSRPSSSIRSITPSCVMSRTTRSREPSAHQKHWLAATWIESLGRPEDHAETIAHHYRSALEFARGLPATHG